MKLTLIIILLLVFNTLLSIAKERHIRIVIDDSEHERETETETEHEHEHDSEQSEPEYSEKYYPLYVCFCPFFAAPKFGLL